jgi:hypothetical protein
MDRKQFLGRTLQLAAGVGLGCPCVALSDEKAKGASAAAGDAGCGKLAGDYAHATTFEKRSDFAKTWVGRFMRLLDERLDEKSRRELMEANGRVCAIGAYGPPDPAKVLGVDELVRKLAAYVGEANCRREGDVVYFSYRQNPGGLRVEDGYCLCPMVEDGPAELSPTFCHCSVGYVAYMFERALGHGVGVELLESVRRGGKACRFAVRVA